MTVERLALVGTGLIGASVGLAAKRAGAKRVVGFDADPGEVAAALKRGAVDEGADDVGEAVTGAELVLVAVPVTQLPVQVRAVLAAVDGESAVTDAGSTKAAVCAAARGSSQFVGGHPVCGSEARGAEHASAELFDGATSTL